MKTNKILFFILLVATLQACTCSRTNKDKSATSKDTQTESLNSIKNDRYHFSFQLPAKWKAGDINDNGDGYTILTGDQNVDFRIYAQQMLANEDDDDYTKKEAFTFEDGKKGTKCYYSDTEYFIYKNNKKTRLAVYISADKSWMQKNEATITTIAKSLKFTK